MPVFEEQVTPKELICELTLDGQLAGHYSIRENVTVLRDGEQFSSQERTRILDDAVGAAIIGTDASSAMAMVQAAQQQIAALQADVAAANAARDAAIVEMNDLKAKAAAAVQAAQPLVAAITPPVA